MTDLWTAAREDTAERNARDIARLVPLVRELARKAGPTGISMENVRRAAVHRGLLTGEETGRRLSFLGSVMKAAGLEATGQYRRSGIAKAHGNLNQVWRWPGA